MTKQRFYVYIHMRADNGKVFYVGSASEPVYDNPSKGFSRARDGRPERRSQYWAQTTKLAGGFTYKIVAECDSDIAVRMLELKTIEKYGLDNLINMRRQAIVWGEEKRRMVARKGEAHPLHGKKLSIETRRKKSESLKGEKHHLFGKHLPKEWRDHIATAKLGERNPMRGRTGAKHPTARAIVNIETQQRYESISEAAEKEGYKMKTLANWLSGFRKNPTPLRYVDAVQVHVSG